MDNSGFWTILPRSNAIKYMNAGCNAVIRELNVETPLRYFYFIVRKDYKMPFHMLELLRIMREVFLKYEINWLFSIPE